MLTATILLLHQKASSLDGSIVRSQVTSKQPCISERMVSEMEGSGSKKISDRYHREPSSATCSVVKTANITSVEDSEVRLNYVCIDVWHCWTYHGYSL